MMNDVLSWLPKCKISQIVIITDHSVKKIYGTLLEKKLKHLNFSTLLFSFPAGEKNKNYKTWQKIIEAMQKNNCDRDTLILALGGGVVGDLAGFVAATYLRGISYIQLPTTLLAMVDSSIGGKTGINLTHGKNLVGSIYQPLNIVTEMKWLETLPKKQLINGLIEAIKMFLTHDADSFYFTVLNLDNILKADTALLKEIVMRASTIKKNVVARDEKEQGERTILNFGHTIGHALEKLSDYTLLHGYAVGYGILVETMVAYLSGLLNREQLATIYHLLARLNIHGSTLNSYDLNALIHATKKDKKVRVKQVNYVLLNRIGTIYTKEGQFIHSISDDLVRKALKRTIAGLK